jgi:hypothetical protein
MVTSHRYLAAGLFALGVLVSAPACATGYAYGRNPDIRDYRELDRRAYDNGFRDGVRNGERDARDRRDFRVDRDGNYRSADDGYRREGGYDRDQYRRNFRRGYEAGYRDGFERLARGSYGGRSVTPGIVIQPPVVVVPRGGYGNSPAAQNGYRDGLETGRKDSRDRERFDPRRAKRYREGDHDYDRRYGDRDYYKREYRSAFEQGYEQGYRGR